MIDEECLVTREQTEARLVLVESELADRLGIRENVRHTLIQLDKSNELVEDELVADWHDLYASYLDWVSAR